MLLWSCNCSINWIASDMEPKSRRKEKQEDDLTGETKREGKRDCIVTCYMIEQLLLEDGEAASG